MSDLPRTNFAVSSHRLDAGLTDELMQGQRSILPPPPQGALEGLPTPAYPQRPELLWAPDEDYLPENGKRHYSAAEIFHHMRGWAFPYFRSRLLPGEFHPIIAYLFNEWKCNLDCNYCWAFDNRVSGMTESVAKRSIDWLHSTSCRVLALMRGEPLLRPPFPH